MIPSSPFLRPKHASGEKLSAYIRCRVCRAQDGVTIRRRKDDLRWWWPADGVDPSWEAEYHKRAERIDLGDADTCATCTKHKLEPRPR